MDITVYILLGIFVFPYVFGPFLLYFVQRIRVPPNIVALDPEKDPLMPEAQNYFALVYERLTARGFTMLGAFRLMDMAPNVSCVLVLYVNRQTADAAASTLIVAEAAGAPGLKTKYTEFATRFENDVTVETNNSTELSAFPPLPGQHSIKLWDIQDIDQLHDLHTAFCKQLASGCRRVLRLDRDCGGDPLIYLKQLIIEESFADQVPTGYLQPCPGGYRPTVWGALVMSWQELWPFKMIRRRKARRLAEQLLADVGFSAKQRS